MQVLTEADLRTAKISEETREYHVLSGTFITPTAEEYLRDRGVRLIVDEPVHDSMSRTEIKKQGMHTYKDAETGQGYQEKPEEMTHLRGNILVPKTHPRIALRGQLDYLQAQILLLQVRCAQEKALCCDLKEVLDFVRKVLGAEVKEEMLSETKLFGYSDPELRRVSHHVREELGINHPIPDSEMGELPLQLNLLRTQVRQAELLAAKAFPEKDPLGIIQGLNRLSSGIYILFCRCVSGFYKNRRNES